MVNMHDILDSEKSRYNFIRGLINLSKAQEMTENSSGIEEEEILFLRHAMSALNLKEEKKVELENYVNSNDNEIVIEFDNMRQALFFLREGIQICHVDGQYSQPEKDMIYVMGQKLNVNANKIKEIEDWVQEGINWLNCGDLLIEQEG